MHHEPVWEIGTRLFKQHGDWSSHKRDYVWNPDNTQERVSHLVVPNSFPPDCIWEEGGDGFTLWPDLIRIAHQNHVFEFLGYQVRNLVEPYTDSWSEG